MKKAHKAMDKARDVTQEKVLPALHSAQESARATAVPAVATAKEKWTGDIVPRVAASVTAAKEAAGPVREEAVRRGIATMAALKGDLEPPPPPRTRRRIGKVLIFAGLAGIATIAARAWRRSQSAGDSWLSADSFAPGTSPALAPDTGHSEPGASPTATQASAVTKEDVEDAMHTAARRSQP